MHRRAALFKRGSRNDPAQAAGPVCRASRTAGTIRRTMTLLALLLLLVDPATTAPAIRGHDPWVFRCALDRQPRMVVVAVAPGWWVAFDAARGSIYKAWEGEVEFTGTVYDTRHGPQPRAIGETLFESRPIRIVGADGDPAFDAKWQWRGYRFVEGEVELSISCKAPDSREIVAVLSPRVLIGDGRPVLRIAIKVSGLDNSERAEFAVCNMNSARISSGRMGFGGGSVESTFAPFSTTEDHVARIGPLSNPVVFDLEIADK
jgi:hypothetical protein